MLFASGSSGVPLLREQLAQVLPSARRLEDDLFGGSVLAYRASLADGLQTRPPMPHSRADRRTGPSPLMQLNPQQAIQRSPT